MVHTMFVFNISICKINCKIKKQQVVMDRKMIPKPPSRITPLTPLEVRVMHVVVHYLYRTTA